MTLDELVASKFIFFFTVLIRSRLFTLFKQNETRRGRFALRVARVLRDLLNVSLPFDLLNIGIVDI